ncbi:MAG: NADH-quinone oxidoreductase subunit D [Deltaproteobacteria bacterium]|nr:NADH-quinone oxidoreductase subunit D [Deltaproteobacteria bacterium]
MNFETQYINDRQMELNMGPQHPSTHGVLRFIVTTDGELIEKVVPDVGYLHRSIEKIGEKVSYHGFMPYTDRVDYVSAMTANHAYARSIEKMANIEVPKRGHYLRMLADELCRLASHLIAIGTYPMDIGAVTPFVHALREREKINDLLEELCGARLTYNYMRIGGVSFDIPQQFVSKTKVFLQEFAIFLDELDRMLSENTIFIQRVANLAAITTKDAIAYGLVGPNLRATGLHYDLRKDQPYACYNELDFEVPVGKGEQGILGDCYDRFIVRVEEMKQSAKMIRQIIDNLPEGPIIGKAPKTIREKDTSSYASVESSRGELGFFVVANGTANAHRVKIRSGSFAAISMLEKIAQGVFIADLVAIIASLDLVAPEIDR